MEKVSQGVTTLEEVLRTVPFDVVKPARCPSCSREVMAAFNNCPFCGAVIKIIQTNQSEPAEALPERRHLVAAG